MNGGKVKNFGKLKLSLAALACCVFAPTFSAADQVVNQTQSPQAMTVISTVITWNDCQQRDLDESMLLLCSNLGLDKSAPVFPEALRKMKERAAAIKPSTGTTTGVTNAIIGGESAGN